MALLPLLTRIEGRVEVLDDPLGVVLEVRERLRLGLRPPGLVRAERVMKSSAYLYTVTLRDVPAAVLPGVTGDLQLSEVTVALTQTQVEQICEQLAALIANTGALIE